MLDFSRDDLSHGSELSKKTNKNLLHPNRSLESLNKLASRAKIRSMNWVHSNLLKKDTVDVYRNGLIPLIHPDLQDDRPRDKSQEISDKPIYIRNYLPSKLRAAEEQISYRKNYLERLPYALPVKLERTRSKRKELGPSFQYGVKTEHERIYKSVENNPFDFSKVDNSMIFYPKWKVENRKKWINPHKDFKTLLSVDGSRSVIPDANLRSLRIAEPYKGGFEEVCDISRKRVKTLEVSPNEFSSRGNNSRYNKYNEYNSDSIRSERSAEFFRNRGENILHSDKSYPRTLFITLNQSNSRDYGHPIPTKEDLKTKENSNLARKKQNALQQSKKLSEILSNNILSSSRMETSLLRNHSDLLSKMNSGRTFDNIIDERVINSYRGPQTFERSSREDIVRNRVSRYFD